MEGVGFWRGLLRVGVSSAGSVSLIGWLGWWGVLAVPLLVPLIWLVEAVALVSAAWSDRRRRGASRSLAR